MYRGDIHYHPTFTRQRISVFLHDGCGTLKLPSGAFVVGKGQLSGSFPQDQFEGTSSKHETLHEVRSQI